MNYKNLIENIDSVIFSISQTGRFLYISPAVEKLIGFSQSQVKGQPYFYSPGHKKRKDRFSAFEELIHPAHRRDVLTRIKRALKNHSDYSATYKIMGTGGYKWVYEQGRYTQNSGSEPRIDSILFDAHNSIAQSLVNQVVSKIPCLLNTSRDLNHLYRLIHESIGSILDLSNFYIALINPNRDVIRFPYNVSVLTEENEQPMDDFYIRHDSAFFSITAHIIETGRSILIKHAEYRSMLEEKEKMILGTPAKVFMGVPLTVDGTTIGAMATQSYTDENYFTRDDLDLFNQISGPIASAIHCKMASSACSPA